MRVTCLKCGHQVELARPARGAMPVTGTCVCGQNYVYPRLVDTGVRPNERAAERSRFRAFRAAGVVRNVGGFALGLALLGILFFPLALAGAAVGLYCVTMLRGPVGRYSGRQAALWAVLMGVVVFVAEGAFFVSWWEESRRVEQANVQNSASDDLRALLRAERIYHATHDMYASLHALDYRPQFGEYTLYLAPDDFIPAVRDQHEVVDPLPPDLTPWLKKDGFLVVAVANLDDDAALDVWTLTSDGVIEHAANDTATP